VDVDLFADRSTLSLEVRDNGIGLSSDALRKRTSFGLRGMSERVHNLGGWLEISGGRESDNASAVSSPGRGTTLMISIPLNSQDSPMPTSGGKYLLNDQEDMQ
jgi:signal transduction histidine kinase